MKTMTLKEIEDRVMYNKKRYERQIEQGSQLIKSKELKRGRVRPRDPDEAEILRKFGR